MSGPYCLRWLRVLSAATVGINLLHNLCSCQLRLSQFVKLSINSVFILVYEQLLMRGAVKFEQVN